jgi:hypothetical protein
MRIALFIGLKRRVHALGIYISRGNEHGVNNQTFQLQIFGKLGNFINDPVPGFEIQMAPLLTANHSHS